MIGGLATIWGALFGAATIIILKNELLLGFGEWDIVIYGLILMLVMIFMPEGLFVKLRELFDRRQLRCYASGAKDEGRTSWQ